MEDLSRIAPYSTFLANNPDIHVNGKPSFIKYILKDLGISEERLVTGVVEARVLYQPMGSRCGYGAFFPLHVFSNTPPNDSLRTMVVYKKQGSIVH